MASLTLKDDKNLAKNEEKLCPETNGLSHNGSIKEAGEFGPEVISNFEKLRKYPNIKKIII